MNWLGLATAIDTAIFLILFFSWKSNDRLNQSVKALLLVLMLLNGFAALTSYGWVVRL